MTERFVLVGQAEDNILADDVAFTAAMATCFSDRLWLVQEGGANNMIKTFGISTARTPDGTWRWELHVPKGSQQDYMKGFAKTEAEAEAAGKNARIKYERDISN